MKFTLEEVVKIVCDELNITKKQVGAKTKRSTQQVTFCKQLICYFAKANTDASNKEIRIRLGYTSTHDKSVYKNRDAIADLAKYRTDEKRVQVYDTLVRVFSGAPVRQCKKGDLFKLDILLQPSSIAPAEHDNVKRHGVYPFVMRWGNGLYHSYGHDAKGVVYGQSEQEYNQAILIV